MIIKQAHHKMPDVAERACVALLQALPPPWRATLDDIAAAHEMDSIRLVAGWIADGLQTYDEHHAQDPLRHCCTRP